MNMVRTKSLWSRQGRSARLAAAVRLPRLQSHHWSTPQLNRDSVTTACGAHRRCVPTQAGALCMRSSHQGSASQSTDSGRHRCSGPGAACAMYNQLASLPSGRRCNKIAQIQYEEDDSNRHHHPYRAAHLNLGGAIAETEEDRRRASTGATASVVSALPTGHAKTSGRRSQSAPAHAPRPTRMRKRRTMFKFIPIVGGAAATAAASALFMMPSIASAAPVLVGKTYAEAAAIIAQQGGTAIVASRVGDQLSLNECIVTSAMDASFVRNRVYPTGPGRTGRRSNYLAVTNETLLHLNCNARVASATTPGNSAASPEGRKAKQERESQAGRRTSTGQ